MIDEQDVRIQDIRDRKERLKDSRWLSISTHSIQLLSQNKKKRRQLLNNYAFYITLKNKFVNSRIYPHNSSYKRIAYLTATSINTTKRILNVLIKEGTIRKLSDGTLILCSFYHIKHITRCKEYTTILLKRTWGVKEIYKALCFAYLKKKHDQQDYTIQKKLRSIGAADEADCSSPNVSSYSIRLSCQTMANFLNVTPMSISRLKKAWSTLQMTTFQKHKKYLGKAKDIPEYIFKIKGVYVNPHLGTVYRQYCDTVSYIVK